MNYHGIILNFYDLTSLSALVSLAHFLPFPPALKVLQVRIETHQTVVVFQRDAIDLFIDLVHHVERVPVGLALCHCR